MENEDFISALVELKEKILESINIAEEARGRIDYLVGTLLANKNK